MNLITSYLLVLLATLVGTVQADWTSVKFIDRVNTAVQNGNKGPADWVAAKGAPTYQHSAWESPQFIDRVNAWKERVQHSTHEAPASVAQMSADNVTNNVVAGEYQTTLERLKDCMSTVKTTTIKAAKKAYDSQAVQHILAQVHEHKKLIAGVAVGAVALYGGYKLISHFAKKHPANSADDLAKEEKAFQAEFEELMRNSSGSLTPSDSTKTLVSSMNKQAQMPSMMKNVNGMLTEQSRLLPYKKQSVNHFIARMQQ